MAGGGVGDSGVLSCGPRGHRVGSPAPRVFSLKGAFVPRLLGVGALCPFCPYHWGLGWDPAGLCHWALQTDGGRDVCVCVCVCVRERERQPA